MADKLENDESCSFDYHLEVANTGFGDMLHDHERNQKYHAALRKTIKKMHDAGQDVHVLDIGTGTGILAMMAVAAGADSVTACECFVPMANCAERIFAANGMEDKIRLIKKRSIEIKIGDGIEDMKRKANLLVTEVLDTELIGEGAIGIYNHAHDNLLTDDVLCIPAKATCFVQIAQSSLAAQWNSLKALPNLDGEILLKPPEDVLKCKSEATLHDVQLSQLPLESFRPITEATKIFEFDFSRKKPRELERRLDLNLRTTSAGSADFVFYWWDIELDSEAEIYLSCAPFWSHPDFMAKTSNVQKSLDIGVPLPNCVPWRDHWMQAIYYIPKALQFTNKDSEFILSCYHDEYSLWFDAFPVGEVAEKVPRHACSCQLHMTYARSRIGQINQSQRNKRYLRYLEEAIRSEKSPRVLVLGDGCILGLACSKLGAAKVICHEPHRFSRQFMHSLAKRNELKDVKFIEDLENLDTKELKRLTHIIAEPYFMLSILPWDNLYFGSLLMNIKDKLSEDVNIMPYAARINAVPVEFLDLHRIRMPVGKCEGFDLKLFDKMVESSAVLSHSSIEAQPLWEYPCRALAQQHELLCIEFRNFDKAQNKEGIIDIDYSGSCNGIALWIDWQLDSSSSQKSIVSTGPSAPFSPGQFIKWDMFVRQGVQLYGKPKRVKMNEGKVRWSCKFEAKTGKLQFDFDVCECESNNSK